MMPNIFNFLAVALVLAPGDSNTTPQDLHEFWQAGTVAERDAVARRWISAGVAFQELAESLPGARRYVADAAKGRIMGTKLQLRGATVPSHLYGRVRATRQGNTFSLNTRGIARLRLLLSPAVIDFAEPVVLKLEGHDPVIKTYEPNAGTLLHWAARDDDRTCLYGVELLVDCATGEVQVVEHE